MWCRDFRWFSDGYSVGQRYDVSSLRVKIKSNRWKWISGPLIAILFCSRCLQCDRDEKNRRSDVTRLFWTILTLFLWTTVWTNLRRKNSNWKKKESRVKSHSFFLSFFLSFLTFFRLFFLSFFFPVFVYSFLLSFFLFSLFLSFFLSFFNPFGLSLFLCFFPSYV